jgi:hypothetical protein
VIILGSTIMTLSALFLLSRYLWNDSNKPVDSSSPKLKPTYYNPDDGQVEGLGDFDDGRKRRVDPAFLVPKSDALYWVNVMLGNGGYVVERTQGLMLIDIDQSLILVEVRSEGELS